MRKYYDVPAIEIRKYRINGNIFTDSDPGLHDGDEYDLDAIDDDNEPSADVFADDGDEADLAG